jgi:hypothetical protein
VSWLGDHVKRLFASIELADQGKLLLGLRHWCKGGAVIVMIVADAEAQFVAERERMI